MKSNNIGVGDQGSTGAGQAAANCGRRPDADPASCGRRPDADSLRRDLLLYAVTDRHWLHGETLYSQVEKALGGGATFVQLREKELDYDDFLADALERVGGVCLDLPPVLGAETPLRYRNKVQFPVAQEKQGLAIGYYRPRSHDVLDAVTLFTEAK